MTLAATSTNKTDYMLLIIPALLFLIQVSFSQPLAVCFEEGTPQEVVNYVRSQMESPLAYQPQGRWFTPASGSCGSFGDPCVLTYSFVDDGVIIPNAIGEGAQPNVLYQRMDSLFNGDTELWKSKFREVFAVWSNICGTSYIEVSDDGASLFSSPGVLGQRGDIRIGMKDLPGGVYAYNYYPAGGDMVIKRGVNWASAGADYRLLKNVVGHEHGHGMGLRHVCPWNGTKLMEPWLNTNFSGPRHDDIRGGMFLYGDHFEPNGLASSATEVSLPLTLDTLAISNGTDLDWFQFALNETTELTITLTPIGWEYLEGVQTEACDTGTLINSATIHTLTGRLYDPDMVLLDEFSASHTSTLSPGEYYVRISGGAANATQTYSLEFTLPLAPPEVTIRVLGGDIQLQWSPVAGAASYTVYRDDDSLTTVAATSFTEAPGTKAVYYVTAR